MERTRRHAMGPNLQPHIGPSLPRSGAWMPMVVMNNMEPSPSPAVASVPGNHARALPAQIRCAAADGGRRLCFASATCSRPPSEPSVDVEGEKRTMSGRRGEFAWRHEDLLGRVHGFHRCCHPRALLPSPLFPFAAERMVPRSPSYNSDNGADRGGAGLR
jgi:hypothetical protein